MVAVDTSESYTPMPSNCSDVLNMGSATMVMTLGNDYDVTRVVELKAAIASLNGVDLLDFNYTNNKLTVKFDPDRVSLSELKRMVAQQEKLHIRQAKDPQNKGRVGAGFT